MKDYAFNADEVDDLITPDKCDIKLDKFNI